MVDKKKYRKSKKVLDFQSKINYFIKRKNIRYKVKKGESMLTLGVNKVSELIRDRLLLSKDNNNVLLIGRAGIGKSSLIRELEDCLIDEKANTVISGKEIRKMKKEGRDIPAGLRKISVFDIRLSAYTVNDLTISMPKSLTEEEILAQGFENNDFAKNVMTTYFADWIVKLQQASINGDKVVLFFDELTHAQLPILRIMYRILAEREIDSIPLPEDMLVIGATNKVEEDSQMTELPGPLLDRFESIIELQENIEDSIAYYMSKKYYTVASFLKCWVDKLYFSVVTNDMTKTISPRTWEKIGKMINSGILIPDDNKAVAGGGKVNMTDQILTSILGVEVGSAFKVFLDNSLKVDIDEFIKTAKFEGSNEVKFSIFSAVIKKLLDYTKHERDGGDRKLNKSALNFFETLFKLDKQYLSVLLLEEELQHFVSKYTKNTDLQELVYTLC